MVINFHGNIGCVGDRKSRREWELQDKKLKDVFITCFPECEKMSAKGRTMSPLPKRYLLPNHAEPMNMWQRGVVHVIKGTDLEVGGLSRITLWSQSSPISPPMEAIAN